MAKIKSAEMETVKDPPMENFSVRIPVTWVPVLDKISKDLTKERSRRIRPSDVIREGVFQSFIKSYFEKNNAA